MLIKELIQIPSSKEAKLHGRSPSLQEEQVSLADTQVIIDVSFTHEQGLDQAFTELQKLDAFKDQLQKEFCDLYHNLMQSFIYKSTIPAGHGWTDDFTCDATIEPLKSKSTDVE